MSGSLFLVVGFTTEVSESKLKSYNTGRCIADGLLPVSNIVPIFPDSDSNRSDLLSESALISPPHRLPRPKKIRRGVPAEELRVPGTRHNFFTHYFFCYIPKAMGLLIGVCLPITRSQNYIFLIRYIL